MAVGNGARDFGFVTPDEAGYRAAMGLSFGSNLGTISAVPMHAGKTVIAPAIGREIASGSHQTAVIDSALAAKNQARLLHEAGGGDGLMLLNSSHRMIAWVPTPR